MPHMETLVATVQESSSMSVLDGDSIVYVARVPTRRRIMTVAIAVGTRFPAFATSMGRVLLAGLSPADLDVALAELDLHSYTESTVHDIGELRAAIDLARERGYSIVDQELEHGLRSVAAPVRDDAGNGDRRRQRFGPRQPGDDRRHRSEVRAATARSRRPNQLRLQLVGVAPDRSSLTPATNRGGVTLLRRGWRCPGRRRCTSSPLPCCRHRDRAS